MRQVWRATHIDGFTRAADRGVQIRIYLDGTQLAEREPAKVFQDLAETPGVEIRIKRDTGALMHIKSYQIDGKLLRTGAANFSASGLKRQDNDLIVIESAAAAAAFKHAMRNMPAARLWRLARSDNETLAEIGRSYNVLARRLPVLKQWGRIGTGRV